MSIMMYQAKKIDDNSEEDTRGSERKVPKNEAVSYFAHTRNALCKKATGVDQETTNAAAEEKVNEKESGTELIEHRDILTFMYL